MIHYRKKTLILKSKKHRIKHDKLVMLFGEKTTFLILKIIFNGLDPSYLKEKLPKKMFKEDEFDYKWDDFCQKLKQCGIKIKKYTEMFIDEDTGEWVDVERSKFKIWGYKN
jgi:hypothetical protein